MPRRPNYGGEKRQKELQRQKKRDEKEEKKRLRKMTPPSDQGEVSGEGAEAADTAGVESDPQVGERNAGGGENR